MDRRIFLLGMIAGAHAAHALQNKVKPAIPLVGAQMESISTQSSDLISRLAKAVSTGKVFEGRAAAAARNLAEPRMLVGNIKSVLDSLPKCSMAFFDSVGQFNDAKKQEHFSDILCESLSTIARKQPHLLAFYVMHQAAGSFVERNRSPGTVAEQWATVDPNFNRTKRDETVRFKFLNEYMQLDFRSLRPAYHDNYHTAAANVLQVGVRAKRRTAQFEETIPETLVCLGYADDVNDLELLRRNRVPAAAYHHEDNLGRGSTPWITMFLIDPSVDSTKYGMAYLGTTFSRARSQAISFGYCSEVKFQSIFETSPVTVNLLLDAVGQPEGFNDHQ